MKYGDFSKLLNAQRDDARFGFQFKDGAQQFVDNLLAVLFPHFSVELLSSPEQIASMTIARS